MFEEFLEETEYVDYANDDIKKLAEILKNEEMSDKMFLVVADFNPDGKRFYESNRFRPVGVIPNLYRSGITEYLMMKTN